MMTERTTACPNMSPCNITTRRPKPTADFMAISVRTLAHSKAENTQWHNSSGGCPAVSMSSFLDGLPESPSPICSSGSSPLSSSTFSPESEVFYSQPPTEFSSPRIQSSCNLSDSSKLSTTSVGIDEWIENNKNLHGFYQPSLHDNYHIEMKCCLSMSSMYESAPTTINPELPSMTIPSVKEDTSIREESSHLECTYSRYGAANAGSPNYGLDKLMTRPKPYHAFLDEVRTQELEAEIDAWKNAKHRKLMNKLARKEAAISDWEFKQTMKAMKQMRKLESKLERGRAQALETTQERINRAKKEADRMKEKARESTVKKISRVTKISRKMRATKNFIWLKLTRFC